MDLKNLFGDFFTHEAGQRRRAWLEEQERRAAENIRYVLGPHLSPSVEALASLAAMFSPGQDFVDAHKASGDLMDWNGPLDAAGDASALAAALGSVLLPGSASRYREGFEALVDDGVKAHQSGRVHMFAGPSAKTADRAALDKATSLEAAGADRDQIWRETGWFRGADGDWRFEIDDTGAHLSDLLPNGKMMDLGDALQHRALYEAYPGMRRGVGFQKDPPSGTHRGYFMGARGNPEDWGMIYAKPRPTDDPLAITLHEAQHAVQELEDFGLGTSPRNDPIPGTPAWDLYQQNIEQIGQMPSLEEIAKAAGVDIEEVKRFSGVIGPAIRNKAEAAAAASKEAYRRSSGEVEANNVTKRLQMTPAQRRATPPWQTQSMPDEEQLISRFNPYRGIPRE